MPEASSSSSPPPDRSHILTEQRNPRSMNLHELSVEQCVALMDQENRAVLNAMDAARPALSAFIAAIEPRFNRGGRLISLGAGTSGRLGVLDASECPPTFQIPPGRIIALIAGGDSALRISSEGKEDDPRGAAPELDALKLTPDDTILAIAAGGTTPYAIGALEHAKRRTNSTNIPLTGLLVCTPIPKPPAADHLIVLATGPEVLTGSTRMKAGTATKLALNAITTTLMIRSGRVYENLMVDMRASNAKLRDRAARIVSTITGVDRGRAFDLLDAAGGLVKVAVVMQVLSVDATQAAHRLSLADGRLDRAIKS